MGYSPNFRGAASKAPARATASGYMNGTMATMALGTPVSIDTSGSAQNVDVSSEASVLAWAGLTSVEMPSGASGLIISDGRIENIVSSFTVGDAIYIDKAGDLTNIKPSEGVNSFVAGDFILFVGVLVKNEFNPSNKDIQLMRMIVGQL